MYLSWHWFGPEVVMRKVRVLEPDGAGELFGARAVRVAVSPLDFLRGGPWRPGRVLFERPVVALTITPDQRILLGGTEVGDSVRVHTKVVEGDKERIQIFSGVVIGRRGRGLNESFTVRRISYGEGVERVFPLHSPRVDKIEVERQGAVRRAKLTYLRKRIGKGATLVKEREAEAKPAAEAAPAK